MITDLTMQSSTYYRFFNNSFGFPKVPPETSREHSESKENLFYF